MIAHIALFLLRERLRRLSFYVYIAVFFALGFFWAAAAGGAIPGAVVDFGAGGKVFVNAPFSLGLLIALTGHFALVITAAMAGRATYDDIEHRSSAFFFTAPISKLDYLGGRFLGAFVTMLLIVPSIGLGAWAAVHSPWLDPTRVGTERAMAYVQPYLTILIPNLFFTSAVFFSLAALTRKMLPVYVAAVVLLAGYLVALGITADLANKTLAALLDPFGVHAVERVTEYWTVSERNTRLIPLEGLLLANRLIWLTVGLALLALTYRSFSFSRALSPSHSRPLPVPVPVPVPAAVFPRISLDHASVPLLLSLFRLQLRETVKNVYFLVIVLAGALFVLSTGREVGRLYGTTTYPVTCEVLEVVGGTFGLFILAIITFASGELVWRERDAGLGQVYDALPVRASVLFTAKLLALMATQVLLLLVVMASGILLQASQGYFHFELGLYLRELFGIRLLACWQLCALAMALHVALNHKYAGHFAMVLFFVISIALPALGFEHHLYRYGSFPEIRYSDMNGYGHFVAPLVWFNVYWSAAAILLATLGGLFWVRGVDSGGRARLRRAAARFSAPARVLGGVALAVFFASGAFIFHNTNRLNQHRTKWQRAEDRADYERRFKSKEALPTPRVIGVRIEADIFPSERRVVLRGKYDLANRGSAPVAELCVTLPAEAHVARLALGRGESLVLNDERLGFRVLRLRKPLAPGEKAVLEFAVEYRNDGFENSDSDTRIVENGTFFDSSYLPVIGYSTDGELDDDDVRHEHALEPRRMADLFDASVRRNNYAVRNADFIDYQATVSTSQDQIALAPGTLQREWTDGRRRYFHYAVDRPMLAFYGFASARYAVFRDRAGDVPIEIYHHPGHEYDLARMSRAVKASLEYFTAAFGPYQHRLVRILEFPRYEQFAQSLPNTIPYSEAIGFIAKVDDSDPESIDYPFYVTAHEVAHQWWAHQVISADSQGATVVTETLAQYSALMVMKREYGAPAMKKFLGYELDRYLRGRGNEKKRELPLWRVEDQPYVHYAKGSLVMFLLQERLGEATVNAVLAAYVRDFGFRGPPYTTAADLVERLKQAAPRPLHYLLHDLFETITLHDNRALTARAKRLPDGRYQVEIRARARKLRADEQGAETEIPLGDSVEIGVLDEAGRVFHTELVRVERAEVHATLVVHRMPHRAGIDPSNQLVDRQPDDNTVRVDAE